MPKVTIRRLTIALFIALGGLYLLAFSAMVSARDPAQVREFMRLHPCPSGPDRGSTHRCRGHVVDHVKPLDCGGRDAPSNMQWQTVAAGHAKDKWERNSAACHHRTHGAKPRD